MKQKDIKVGGEYIIINNGNCEKLKDLHLTRSIVLNVITGRNNDRVFHVNKRYKKPNKYVLKNGAIVKANNLKEIE